MVGGAKANANGAKGEVENAPTHLLNGIHHMDSLEGMKQLPDASVDLVITSPPYADMKVYEGVQRIPSRRVRPVVLPHVSEIARI